MATLDVKTKIPPAFTVHTSNRTENLLKHLESVLQTPLSSPFKREVFLVQSQGMERWLLQSLSSCNSLGVMANFEMLFPKGFFTGLAALLGVDTSAAKIFDRSALVWVIDAVLAETEIPEVKAYVGKATGTSGVDRNRRFELAQQLSNLFDDYQTFRSQWLSNARTRQHSSWVFQVWDALIVKLNATQGALQHNGEVWESLISAIEQLRDDQLPAGWPERVSVFGIHAMPPIFLRVLNALAKRSQVHLYVTQPTKGYWGDIRGRAEAKRDQVYRRLEAVHTHAQSDSAESEAPSQGIESNESSDLLSLLGQQGRDFHKLMLEYCQFDWEFDSTDETQARTTLERLQQSLIAQTPVQRGTLDESIRVNSCHSRLREVEVLKDQLLDLFSSDKSLMPGDVLVMAPNIPDYAPFIESVFATEHELPFTIADRSEADTNPYYKAFISVIRAAMGRFERSQILELIELGPIKGLLSYSDEDVESVRAWIDQAAIRWGHSAAHKSQYDLPALATNTWDAGLKQMMLGFMMQGEEISIEGESALLMARLDGFIRTLLVDLSARAQQERTPSEWADLLVELKEALFREDQKECRGLNQMLAQLKEVAAEQRYPLSVILKWLENQYQETKGPQGFLNGLITCCSMLPMRNIPFKVIAVLGLNDGDFPRLDRRPSFDLMADDHQPGDRSVRADGRYQFLEILLSARQRLILSYRGQSDAKLQTVPPSGVVAELLNELVVEPEKAITKHPLQPFSGRYFNDSAESPLFTFSQTAEQIYSTIRQKAEDPGDTAWLNPDLAAYQAGAEPSGETIDFADLVRFAREPQKWFIQRRLGIYITTLDDEVQDSEPFKLNALEGYKVNQLLLDKLVAGEDSSAAIERLRNRGSLPADSFGQVDLEVTTESIEQLVRVYQSLGLGESVETKAIESADIDGEVSDRYQRGVLLMRYGSLKPKEQIRAWLTHLVSGEVVWLLGAEKGKPLCYRFETESPELRSAMLAAWVAEYRRALNRAPQLWLDLGWTAAEVAEDEVKRRQRANGALDSALGHGYNSRPDNYIIRAAEGRRFEEIWSAAVEARNLELLTPALANRHKEAV